MKPVEQPVIIWDRGSKKVESSASCYLIGVELSFLAESRRQILGLDLLLGHMVLVEKMLVLHLGGDAQTEVSTVKQGTGELHPRRLAE